VFMADLTETTKEEREAAARLAAAWEAEQQERKAWQAEMALLRERSSRDDETTAQVRVCIPSCEVARLATQVL
jgi:hypothetical protein